MSLTTVIMYELNPYMNDGFICESFRRMGYMNANVKIQKNRYTGKPLGHAYVQFPDEKVASCVMTMCNGQIIPNSNPPVRFKLSYSGSGGVSFGASKMPGGDKECILWIGNLSREVSDQSLYRVFATRYNSVKHAKVVKEMSSSNSRGYGFVKFGNEGDHRDALAQMQGFRGLGSYSILVGLDAPKGSDFKTQAMSIGSYAGYIPQAYDLGNYSSYQNYGVYFDSGGHSYNNPHYNADGDNDSGEEYDDYRLVEYDIPLDVARMNREVMERSLEFWDALDSSRWLPTQGIFSNAPTANRQTTAS